MTSSDANELAEDLAKSLHAVTTLTQSLLGEIRDNATSLAVLKEKFDVLAENMEVLSKIIRMGNGQESLLTRVALLEKSLSILEQKLDEKEEDIQKIEDHSRAFTMRIWKMGAVLLPGLIALAVQIIKAVTGVE